MEYPEIAALRAVDALAAMRLSAAIRNLEEQRAATGWAARQLPSLFASDNETERLDLIVALAQEASPDAEVWAVRWSGDFVAGTASFQALAGAKREIPPPGVISRSLVGRAIASGKPLWMDDPTRRAPESAASIVVSLVGWVGCAPLGNNGVLYLSGPPGTRVPPASVRARIDTLAQLAAAILDAAAVATVAGAPAPSRKTSPATELPGIVGSSAPMRELARAVRAFAPLPAPALVRGETGTGKEAVARAFHALSPRKDRPFISVNCATIPEELAESMIFGHEKGAFTGADRTRVGLAEESAGGTLFLDEIGELPARVQPKLLRLLQEGTFTRVGSSKEQQFTGRIVGATLRPLEDANSFRGDLYHRLAACVVHTPRSGLVAKTSPIWHATCSPKRPSRRVVGAWSSKTMRLRCSPAGNGRETCGNWRTYCAAAWRGQSRRVRVPWVLSIWTRRRQRPLGRARGFPPAPNPSKQAAAVFWRPPSGFSGGCCGTRSRRMAATSPGPRRASA